MVMNEGAGIPGKPLVLVALCEHGPNTRDSWKRASAAYQHMR
jgi:hypothetical protein